MLGRLVVLLLWPTQGGTKTLSSGHFITHLTNFPLNFYFLLISTSIHTIILFVLLVGIYVRYVYLIFFGAYMILLICECFSLEIMHTFDPKKKKKQEHAYYYASFVSPLNAASGL